MSHFHEEFFVFNHMDGLWMVCLPPNCVLTTIQILRKQIEKQKSTTKQTRPYTTKYNKNPKDQNLKNKQSNLAVNVK